jgi:hypothetical protein
LGEAGRATETLDGKQVQRWSETLGSAMVRQRDAQVVCYREGQRPESPANAPQLLVIGLDGGRYQAREKDPETPEAAMWGERTEALLWDGRVGDVIAALQEQSDRLGAPRESDPKQHPRRIVHQNVGYFTKHQEHMRYPEYRRKGWPIGSGVTEAAVKQFNKRVKGTEQFWSAGGIESILALRATWIDQDQRWERYWANRPGDVK